MDLGSHGVFSMTDSLSPTGLVDLAKGVEALGYSTLWYPEAFKYEPLAMAGYLLSHSEKLIVASGIINIYARDATTSVMGYNTLNALYGGRFVLGLGVSHAPLVSDVRGHEYSNKPVATMRAYLDAMDAAWEAFGGAPEEKQMVLAALGPNMLKLGGERSLGVIPANVTAQHAAMARQQMGADKLVCSEVHVCMTEDPAEARAAARAALEFYLPLPNYTNNWARLGFDSSHLENGGSDELMDALVAWGTLDQIKARLKENFDNGANQTVIHTIRPDGQSGPDWDALEALAPTG
jgi:probable F420-dependent oxidoreductase